MTEKNNILISVDSVRKSFSVGDQIVEVLKNVSIDIYKGEFVIIVGPSGSGKSTLMHVMLGLEVPTTGSVLFNGQDIYTDKDEDFRSEVRKTHIGMVYQQPHWIRALNVLENIAFPLYLLGKDTVKSQEVALEALSRFGLGDWGNYYPTELSSGQQQRVSMARALVNDPLVIFADEPTGNLDYTSGQKVLEHLKHLSVDGKKSIIMVTHDLEYLSFADTAVHIFDGNIAGVYRGDDILKLTKSGKLRAANANQNPADVSEGEGADARGGYVSESKKAGGIDLSSVDLVSR